MQRRVVVATESPAFLCGANAPSACVGVRAGGRLSCSQSPSEELDCKSHEGRACWLSPLIGSCSDPRASSVRASPLVALHLMGKLASEPVNRP